MIVLAGIGGVCGFIVALITRRQSLLPAIIFSFIIGTAVPSLPFGKSQATTVVYPEHHSVIEAVAAVLAGMLLCLFFTPFACGLPAVLFGYVTHRLLHVGKKPSA